MPDITASLSYIAKLPIYNTEKPYRVIPSALEPEIRKFRLSNVEPYVHDSVQIRDMRPFKSDLSIEKQGFEVLSHISRHPRLTEPQDFEDYRMETAELLQKHFDAVRVICWDIRASQTSKIADF